LTNKYFVVLIFLFASSISHAEQSTTITTTAATDVVDKVIANLFRKHIGQFLCMPQGASRESVRAALKDRLDGVITNDDASANAIANAIYTAFPCPFSPYRTDLRPASAADITGNWLFPEGSQRFRYGPKSPAWQSTPGMPPVKCEGVSYLASGVLLIAQVMGTRPCPTLNDMKTYDKFPMVETWTFVRDGRVKIDRSDIENHGEVWDIFVVEKEFYFAQTQFAVGDLVEYLRDRDNEFNVATMFRHLQRMQAVTVPIPEDGKPASFNRFTDKLPQLLETDASSVMARGLTQDSTGKLCARLGNATGREVQREVAEWRQRNDKFIKAAANALNEFGNQFLPVGGESAKQGYFQMILQATGQAANQRIVEQLNGANLDNNIVPQEFACAGIARLLHDRKRDFENTPKFTRALVVYMDRSGQ